MYYQAIPCGLSDGDVHTRKLSLADVHGGVSHWPLTTACLLGWFSFFLLAWRDARNQDKQWQGASL